MYLADPRFLYHTPGLLRTVIAVSGSATPKANYMFIPQTLKLVQVNTMTVKLYPIDNLTMKPPEHAHAFQINKTALAAPGIDRRMMLNILSLGAQLNLSPVVDVVFGNWNRHFHCTGLTSQT